MELEGKIIKVLETRSGTSPRTGSPWKLQSFVLETPGQYPRRMVFEVFGEERLNQMNIQEGQELKVSFDIDAREYNGRWFNDIRAYNVIRGQQPVPGAQPVAAPSEATSPFPPAQEPASEGASDDLPF